MSARDELAARQASLVAALVAGAGAPTGMDGERVRIQAAALLGKRGRGVAHAEPELAAALGASFGPAFAEYATGRPRQGCYADDAAAFGRYLLSSKYGRDREVRRVARRVTLARLLSRVSHAISRRGRATEEPPSPVLAVESL